MSPTKESLEQEIKDLEATLVTLQTKRTQVESKLKYRTFVNVQLMKRDTNGDPAAAVKRHIKLLHDYNEIRDVALNFVGKIAEKERCRAIDVLKEYDLDEKD